MKCKKCNCECKKAGKQNGEVQKWYCKICKKYQLENYSYKAYEITINEKLIALLKEGCGIRSIARSLFISPTTVIKRIRAISKNITPPTLRYRKEYELDEMRSFIQKKSRLIWIVYAIQRDTREVVTFNIGRRTNKTLRVVTETLALSNAIKIYTDKLNSYKTLIEKEVHNTNSRATNYIERNHLTVRTHLKRLNRKSICFSKTVSMLVACLRIYFWA